MQHLRFEKAIRVLRILGHTGLILFFLIVPLLLFYQTKIKVTEYDSPFVAPEYWYFVLVFIAFFYGYTYRLLPMVLVSKQYGKFFVIFLLICILFYFSKPAELYFRNVLLPLSGLKPRVGSIFTFDVFSFLIFIMLTALGLTIQMIKQWRASEKRVMQAETDKKNAELSFLKAQINPHLFFNTLNTIYSLILTKNPMAADSVLKLSNIMRYVTDDASANFVSLEKEVATISDFIALQKLQYGKKVQVGFSVFGELKHKQIAPLVLLTYIENAFKYGVSNHILAPITIKLDIQNDSMEFMCQNRIFSTNTLTERTGVGLVNTRKRLEYLYQDKYDLTIDSDTELYTVKLHLQLS